MGSVQYEPGRRPVLSFLEELALSQPLKPVFQYPKTLDPADGFVTVTTEILANAVNRVAWWIEKSFGKCDVFDTIGYVGPSDLRYIVLVLGASKAGFKMLLTSPRNSLEAHHSLIDSTECNRWIMNPQMPVEHILQGRLMETVDVLSLGEMLSKEQVPVYPYHRTFEEVCKQPFAALHTSGSTGLPKPIIMTQGIVSAFEGIMQFPPVDGRSLIGHSFIGDKIYLQLPPFHAAGLYCSLCWSLYLGSCIVYGPASAPNLLILEAMFKHLDFDVLFTAPSTLEDVVKSPILLNRVSKLRSVGYGGGPLGQETGEFLWPIVELRNTLGTTEAMALASLRLDKEDWAYCMPHPLAGVEFRPHSENLFQMFYVRGGNAEEFRVIFHTFPDVEEYDTRDLFSAHPTKPGLWRYEGRSDDIIVLSNGEKVNPLSMEATIATNRHIRSALVVGQARFQVAALIEPRTESQVLDTEADIENFIDEIWPLVEAANIAAPAHARITSKRQIRVVAPDTFLRAGKGTIQRFQTLKVLKETIDNLYQRSEAEALAKAPRYDISSLESIRNGIRATIMEVTKYEDLHDDDNLFAFGADSLHVTTILKLVKAGLSDSRLDGTLSTRFVYAHPSVNLLSKKIHDLVEHGLAIGQNEQDSVDEMLTMLETHTADLPPASLRKQKVKGKSCVLLTGSTGSLGSYILNVLMNDDNVEQIWCLNRSSDAQERQTVTNSERGLRTDFSSRVRFVNAHLSHPNLGLDNEMYDELVHKVTHIIHNQWQVDFNVPLSSFERHIRGTRELIELCYKSTHRKSLLFTSSIGVIDNWSTASNVPETVIQDLSVAGMGYGKSKLVAELLLHEAGQHQILDVQVCRVGQIAGPISQLGSWNRKEWLPTIIDASAHLGLVPGDLGYMSMIDWIPVDMLSHIIWELACSPNAEEASTVFFHTVNPQAASWSSLVEVIQTKIAKTTKGQVEIVSFKEWCTALRKAVDNPSGVDVVPGSKLLDFYDGLAEEGRMIHGNAALDTENTEVVSKTLRGMKAVNAEWMSVWMTQWGYL